MATPLINRYRPTDFDNVLGQEHIVTSLKQAVETDNSHTYIFTGPAGHGKTTLARIIASKIGCEPGNLIEIDGASKTGVDDMRVITNTLRYQGFGNNAIKCIIIDEAHRLSGNAWDSILKSTEEPPPHVYWIFNTTNDHKIPYTIKTRCLRYSLKPIPKDTIYDHLCDIADKENFEATEEVIDLITREAHGSVRKAIADLATCANITDRKIAADLLKTAGEDSEVLSLCRLLAKGQGVTWDNCMRLLQGMEDYNPESIRIMIINYFIKAAMGKQSKKTLWYLRILEAFSEPCHPQDKLSPILLALGDLIYEVE